MLPVDMAGLHGHRGKDVRDFLVPYTNATQLVETDGFRGILNGISIVAVLIVTVTFIGMQTPPGGGSDSEGGQLKLCRMDGRSLCDEQKIALNQAALKAYVILDGLSLFWAATDLLLVLAFLLPGVSKRYRTGQRVAWVWCMLVSCSLLLAASLVCAVGAFVAAGFTVVPPEEYCLLYIILAFGGAFLVAALILLFRFIDSARSPDTYKFIWEELLGWRARGPEARAPSLHPAVGLAAALSLPGQLGTKSCLLPRAARVPVVPKQLVLMRVNAGLHVCFDINNLCARRHPTARTGLSTWKLPRREGPGAALGRLSKCWVVVWCRHCVHLQPARQGVRGSHGAVMCRLQGARGDGCWAIMETCTINALVVCICCCWSAAMCWATAAPHT